MPVDPKSKPQDESRRRFLLNSGVALGGLMAGGVLAGIIGDTVKDKPKTTPPQKEANKGPYQQALMFFTQEAFQITEAAAERIFPKDDAGPGAKELGVAYYIDHQLAGQWGVNAREYMMGPFQPGEETQGYQARLKRNDLFLAGLGALRDYSMKKYNKSFQALESVEQDEVLKVFEKGGEVKVSGLASSATFFSLLRQLTLEGVYADPMYSGNADMQGWRMRSYPGAKMSYINDIEKDKFIKYDPVSLHSMM
ncbi:gluconate 2-dehydrogenase subunit 3 family protein [Paenibacillus aurantius]|uniref:Gluconate 2-dehydrogenase subunit 3 family protein n=1 Tax=Paenibacillus aurantius TaxID=2918900 RepID=A0AA96LEJ3_9BACL|nr:gluconate 2-dehydrogenase subunit 3 family protein [Paenibacillus aurantius]WNQ10621.1 gluconate 2-dehydrogenase subunit 3 family protein [Paenibacillus aurantius]